MDLGGAAFRLGVLDQVAERLRFRRSFRNDRPVIGCHLRDPSAGTYLIRLDPRAVHRRDVVDDTPHTTQRILGHTGSINAQSRGVVSDSIAELADGPTERNTARWLGRPPPGFSTST
jgi:hypothetical protein